MKKRSNIVKIFGIGAAVLMIIMAFVPACTAWDENGNPEEGDTLPIYDQNGVQIGFGQFWNGEWQWFYWDMDEDDEEDDEDDEEDEEDDEVPWWLEALTRFFEGMQGYTVGDGARGALQRIREERYWEEHPQ